jgi:formamidopyrimidine-DNA glycosylase
MPELPDILTYIGALESRIVGERLIRVRIASTFLLRSAQPPIREVEGRVVRELRRIGKRIAIGAENDLWVVLHLMIGSRLHLRPSQALLAGRNNLAAFDFPNGSLILTEAGTKRRASLHLLRGEESLRSMDPGGIDLLTSDLASFRFALSAENRTLKRALTDPRLVSGIGNAYSDEILHAAQLSPVMLTHKLKPDEWERLFVPRVRRLSTGGPPASRSRYGLPRPMPDRWNRSRRSQSLAAVRIGVAAHSGRIGGAQTAIARCWVTRPSIVLN